MFKRKEKQSLLEARTKALKNAEEEIKKLRQLRTIERKNNEKILKQNNEKTVLINKIEKLISSNKYNNEKIFIKKIKELVDDYQSLN